MNNSLDEIERKLHYLFEEQLFGSLAQVISKERFSQLVIKALNGRLLANKQTETITFFVVVHPTKMEFWKQDPNLLGSIKSILQTILIQPVFSESWQPTLKLKSDPILSEDEIDIRITTANELEQTTGMPANLPGMPTSAAFLIVSGANVYSLDQKLTNIGRYPDNHIVLSDPRVSRHHAQIRFVHNHFQIFDLNSTGGTLINGQKTLSSILFPGDVISFAGLHAVFGTDSNFSGITRGDTTPLSKNDLPNHSILVNSPDNKDTHQF